MPDRFSVVSPASGGGDNSSTLANVDPGLYEAAKMDGASVFQHIWNIGKPELLPIWGMQKTKKFFSCHGNIYRSPKAELVRKGLVKKAGPGPQFCIEATATSTEKIGSPVYFPARAAGPSMHASPGQGRKLRHEAGTSVRPAHRQTPA